MDFSFSGLKTALLEKCQSMATISDQDRCDLARAFLNACADHIADRLKKSISLIRSEKMRHENLSIVLGGGVARNDYLYNRYLGYIYSTNIFRLAVLLQSENCALIRPAPKLCVDNATMIAWAALEYINSNIDPQKYDTVCQDWPLQDLKLNTWRNILS
jgi:N6-L-threonylcarbamoyladenine synthase